MGLTIAFFLPAVEDFLFTEVSGDNTARRRSVADQRNSKVDRLYSDVLLNPS